jgi:hypothetical protein
MSPRTQAATTFVLSLIGASLMTALTLFVVVKDTGAVRGMFTEARAFCVVADTEAADEPMPLDECVTSFDELDEEYQDLLWESVG